jgi:hypothetical protein
MNDSIPGYQIEVPVVVFFNPASKDPFEAGVSLKASSKEDFQCNEQEGLE